MSAVTEARLSQPSACRFCGQTTSSTDRQAQWRFCRRCERIAATASHGALWQEVTGDSTITDAEGYWLTTEGMLHNPAFFVRDPETWWTTGNRKPWQHLPGSIAADARAALRRHRDGTKMRKHPSGPCALCGVRRDDAWTVPATERGRPVCGPCAGVLGRFGSPAPGTDDHADATTTACLGWEPFIGIGQRVPVTPYAAWEPDGTGHDLPWAHVPAGSRSEARIRLANVATVRLLTPDERAEHARRAEAAAADWAAQAGRRPDPISLR